MTDEGTRESCSCEDCKSACRRKPGWFTPGQIERVAEHLQIPLAQLFKTKLAVDFYYGEGDDSDGIDRFAISPAVVGNEPGQEFPVKPVGRCVFYEKGRCTIHAVKPDECRLMLHSIAPTPRDHLRRAKEWDPHRAQIIELLGHEPATPQPTLLDVLDVFMWTTAPPEEGDDE